MLEAKKKISLSLDIESWVRAGTNAPGLTLVPLTPAISITSTRLAGMGTANAADRIIVATARDLNATLLTCDRAILEFAKSGSVKAIDARS